ncbi:MAG: RNA polymerase sigma factor [Aquihabitans sp.]
MDDEADFETWYRREHRRLVNALVVAAGDLDLGREVADEAFARCLQRWDGPRRPYDPCAWTYLVAVNLLRRRWRRRRREHDLLLTIDAPRNVDLPEPAVDLWRAVAALPERMRLAVVLRYLAGMTEPEVGAVMGIAPGTVGATLTKARRHLAAALEPKEPSDV